MNHKGTKTIETDRLVLRAFTMNDADAMFRNWESDPEVTEFLRWKTASSITETKQVLGEWVRGYEDPDFYQWAIVLKEIGEPIGSISVVGKNEKLDIVHIGYCIGSRWWRRGYTSEAFQAIIPFFFTEVGVNRIESQHDPNNPNSGLVMQKCGLRYEGTLRQADWNNKGIVDACMYSLLRSEWENTRV
ncbi:MAG: GNAT family N-acetyltransferase [Clostridia bacterium]|nr:GNAT family N-acetyltransferase [Clostridia bacterium]